jgi:hypothetical protein
LKIQTDFTEQIQTIYAVGTKKNRTQEY